MDTPPADTPTPSTIPGVRQAAQAAVEKLKNLQEGEGGGGGGGGEEEGVMDMFCEGVSKAEITLLKKKLNHSPSVQCPKEVGVSLVGVALHVIITHVCV